MQYVKFTQECILFLTPGHEKELLSQLQAQLDDQKDSLRVKTQGFEVFKDDSEFDTWVAKPDDRVVPDVAVAASG